MKKLLFGAVALAMLATSSCKKDDDASGPSNSLTAAGQVYAVTSLSSTANIVLISAGSGTTEATVFTLTFGTGLAKPSDGTYNIVEDADAANEVDLSVSRYVNSTLTQYTSRDNSPNVTVKTEDGKMKVSFGNTTVKPVPGRGSEDIVVSANASQL